MEYIAHLEKDRKLSKILVEALEPLTLHKNIPIRLMASIMSQQLSTKVAKVIFRRFLDLYGGKEPTVAKVMATDPTTLRAIGLSNNKVSYILNVAQFLRSIKSRIKNCSKWRMKPSLNYSPK